MKKGANLNSRQELSSLSKHSSVRPKDNKRSVQNYKIQKQVGQGTFGEVFKAQSISTAQKVALKKIIAQNRLDGFPLTALREIKLLTKMNHDNILNLIEVIPESISTNSNETLEGYKTSYMVLDYLSYDLTGVVENRKITLDQGQIKCILKQVLEGLHYMHKNRIMHRDLKTSNLLLDEKGRIRIADFGLARSWVNVKNFKYTTKVVTLWYRAPELLLDFGNYTPKIDIWALGCIFAELVARSSLLPGKDEGEQLHLIFKLCGTPSEEEYPKLHEHYKNSNSSFVKVDRNFDQVLKERLSSLDETGVDLLKKMLTINPDKRITAEDALDHDYFWSGSQVDKQHDFITKIKKQMGEVQFNQGMHEYEVREYRKKLKEQEAEEARKGHRNHNRGFSRGRNKRPRAFSRGDPSKRRKPATYDFADL
eukprot:augustus_masked-scaffold_1-processed-gene-5.48-mRNA-1 protein AED:0.03 eAED:0.03 QI:0/-1/0/1/-1/1/1/0/422